MGYYQNYYVECDWSASKKNHSTSKLASLAIDHAVSTGHDIDSRRDFDDPEDAEIDSKRSERTIGSGEYHQHS